jgi:hypothetical protein
LVKNEIVKDAVDQFMWGFQQHFRAGVQRGIEQVLSRVGLPVEVRVVLVGFALRDGLRHQVCVEPEDGPLLVSHLATVASRAAELFDADPESKIIQSNPRLRQLRHAGNIRRSRADALVEAIEGSGMFNGLTFFAGTATPIGDYEVHTCAGVPTEALNSPPALDESVVDRVYVGRSLQHEVIAECLRRADLAMYLPEPGADLYPLGAPTEDIVKAAAVRLIDGTVYRVTGTPADLFQAVNAFVSLSYERAGAGGHLVITNKEKACQSARVRFQRPISLREARIMRKLLELSDDSTSVLTDGQSAYGLGTSDPAPDTVEISVRGHATWELSVDGSALVKVTYGQAALPRPLLDFANFADSAARTVGSIDTEGIWQLIQAAQVSGHGTTLVLSSSPAEEAARLGGQAVAIEPGSLEPADIVRLGNIDGAVVLGPDGRCYAFGVILDGIASGRGDPARGSRFNSAIRYQDSMAPNSLLVVISDDGTVDLVPQLRHRVNRNDVEAAVRTFCERCEDNPVNGEEFARTHDRVKANAFYLDDAQCQLVNDAYTNEMRRRFEAGGISITEAPLRPHPDMNDSYFIQR